MPAPRLPSSSFKFKPDILLEKDLKLNPYGLPSVPAAKQLAAVTSKPAEVATTYTKPVTPAPSVAQTETKPLASAEPKLQPAPQTQSATTAPAATATPAPTGGPTITPGQYSQAFMNVYNQLLAKANAPPVTADQIAQSQEYRQQAGAIDAIAAQNVGQATANIRRQLASRNMIRSTPAVQALASAEGDIMNRAAADKAALIPSMLANAYNRQQADLKNTFDLLRATGDMEDAAFDRGYKEFTATAPYKMLTKGQEWEKQTYETEKTEKKEAAEAKAKADAAKATEENAWKIAEQTGVYYDPAAIQLANAAILNKEKYEQGKAQGKTDAELAPLSEEATKARAQLKAMGIDADALFGAKVTAADARKNIGKLGQWTLEGRKKEWEMTGVDPVTGANNPEFILKDMQARKYAADAAVAQIEAKIADDPVYGASAKAKADLAKAQKDLAKADADIAATWALANERTQNAANAKENPKETDAERRAREATEKKRTDTITSTRRDYPLASQGAAEIWADALMYGSTPNDDGSLPTVEEVGQFIDDMIAQTPGLLPSDADFLRTYLWATQGQKWAAEKLPEWKPK